MKISEKEVLRRAEQIKLDNDISFEERNKGGQFATPYELASQIVEDGFLLNPGAQNVLEPACGTGAFISSVRSLSQTTNITACELDSRFFNAAADLWSDKNTAICQEDFFDFHSDKKFDLLFSNPPYCRHHHLPKESKDKYKKIVSEETGFKPSALSGLHAYFILRGNNLLSADGYAFWLVPSELFSVNYGSIIKDSITSSKAVRRIHFFNSTNLQFEDALVSSCVLIVQNKTAKNEDKVELTFGDFSAPSKITEATIEELRKCTKWQHFSKQENSEERITLKEFFTVRRGIATGDNSFFVKPLEEWALLGIDKEWLKPVVSPPRAFKDSVIMADSDGWPLGAKLAVLDIDSHLTFEFLPTHVQNFLNTCPEETKCRYLVRKRKLWYCVEKRMPAPIICTYMSRSNETPFRFIRNQSDAIVLNNYLGLYPTHTMDSKELDEICQKLNQISSAALIKKSREYGGGLRKLEPNELLSICL